MVASFRSAASRRRCSRRTAPAIKRVILPERNVADLEEVPQEIRDTLEFICVSKMDEVLDAALESP